MGLFDFFRGKQDAPSPEKPEISRNEFARLMMDALQAAGAEGLSYDEPEFCLRIAQHNSVFFLGNVYAEYLSAPREARSTLVQNYALTQSQPSPSVAEDWEDAAPQLIPLVRSRMMFENLPLSAEDDKAVAWQPLGTSLGLALGYDLPTTITYVQRKALGSWGVSYEQALSRASENLLERSRDAFTEISPGLFRSPWSDTHDPARMVVPEVLSRLGLRGRPVVGVPHRNILLAAGSEDAPALNALAAAIEKELTQPRANTCCAYIMGADGWQPYVPPAEHPAHGSLLKLRLMSQARDYAEQTEKLEAEHKKSGQDIFVAKISVITDRQSNLPSSYAVWVRDLPTLLPRTSHIVLCDPLRPEKQQILGRVPWDEVAARCPELTQPAPGYPERFYLQGFPTPEALVALLEKAVG